MKKTIKLLIMMVLLFVPFNIKAQEKVNIYFFYSPTCTYCAQQRDYLESIKEKKNLDIYYYNLSNKKNDDVMVKALNLYNQNPYAVPFTVIGNTPIKGFVRTQIDDAINNYNGDDQRLLVLLEDAVRMDMNAKLNSDSNNATAVLIFFGVILAGLFFLMKPEKRKK